ncbi:MAG: RagB/SusD family nutrient uptake outer membrane protein, partial [Bacteroidota bacterium]
MFLFSCNDILDLEPQDAVSDAAVWSNPELLELYINSRYGELPHGYVQWAGGLRVSGLTDESYHMHQPQHLNKHTEGGLNPVNMHLFGGFWMQAYSEIRNLNLFIENANPAIGDADRINQLISEARFLRSWYYIELFSRYGAVPLITSSIEIDQASQIEERTPVIDLVQFIDEELTN